VSAVSALSVSDVFVSDALVSDVSAESISESELLSESSVLPVPELSVLSPELSALPSELSVLSPELSLPPPELSALPLEFSELSPELSVPPELSELSPELSVPPPELSALSSVVSPSWLILSSLSSEVISALISGTWTNVLLPAINTANINATSFFDFFIINHQPPDIIGAASMIYSTIYTELSEKVTLFIVRFYSCIAIILLCNTCIISY
jgi:hypothetical protein